MESSSTRFALADEGTRPKRHLNDFFPRQRLPSKDPSQSGVVTTKRERSVSSDGTHRTYLTPRMIREEIGVCSETVLSWINTRELKASNISNGSERPRWRVARADLNSFLDRRSNQVNDNDTKRRRRRRKPLKRYFEGIGE